jgi:hypothetical protein
MTMVSNYSSEFKQTSTTHIADHIHEWHRRRSLCKAEATKQQCLNWFLKSLVSLLAKDVATTFPQSEEEAIDKANSSNSFIHSQDTYIQYYLMPSRPMPFGQDKPGMSHSVDGLIGTTTHHNSHLQQPPMYGTPQYPSAYGGPPYYPPPPYQQPYPVSLPPPISGPPLTPTVHPTAQPSSGTPSTSNYTLSTSESTTCLPIYPMDHFHQIIHFPFPGPFHFLALHSPWLHHKDTHMLGLTLFNPLPFSNIKILNS